MTEAVYGSERRGADLALAGQGRRLGAFVLDIVLFAITLGIGWLIWLLVVGQRGQSPAKQLLGMHVVEADGSRARRGLMVLREVMAKWLVFSVLDLVLSLIDAGVAGTISSLAFAVAALWCVWDANRQCLWDKALGTYVVREVNESGGVSVTSFAERTSENLQTLKEMHERGLLTDEQYEERRAREVERL